MVLKIFPDGSKILGKVGVALSLWTANVEIGTVKLKLFDHCMVYQAELLALCRATGMTTVRRETTKQCRTPVPSTR